MALQTTSKLDTSCKIWSKLYSGRYVHKNICKEHYELIMALGETFKNTS